MLSQNIPNIFLYFIAISLGSELRLNSHYFRTSKQTPDYIELYYEKGLKIISYEIYEGDIGASFNSFMPIRYENDLTKTEKVLFIDVSSIDKRIDKEYVIWINHEENEVFYSNTFFYDTEEGYFKFTRRYVDRFKRF
ncbi:hypothetical protein NBO_84g0014 [Nosema bombycis CQ1]|uniref:Uncharacterized protein n=1 Tax=Nosema bombycis (strain CQ1 / CVCC 102059) TaxID=578461 RepID=R0KRC6_NOSB1|nr:hypothetical protein NBO_84g0014 [Nosema bombycis CQ1]|eukprot:EOB13296.1 hypothetical protein NBO_84g0014 [Nosema bombycis CQ1]